MNDTLVQEIAEWMHLDKAVPVNPTLWNMMDMDGVCKGIAFVPQPYQEPER